MPKQSSRHSKSHKRGESKSVTKKNQNSRGNNGIKATLGKRPKHQKLEIKFDPEARKKYLTGLSSRKKERRAYGLAMQKVKDRRAKIEQRKEERQALMDQIEEAERLKRSNFMEEDEEDNDDSEKDGNDDESQSADGNVKVETFADESTKEQFGGDVIVTTSYGIPSDDESADREALGQGKSKKGVDIQQRFAGNVKRYMDQIRKQLPSKKAKLTRNVKGGGKKGQHGAEKMIGGNAKDIKLAKKTLSRIEGKGKKSGRGGDERSGGGRRKGKR
mmetsp:Transcript_9901/g.18617  ORF Transcript_9901/g.18617 Transcript_9901/m.18617 type:complete len:274 (+) Transcript_9901:163-984(+)